MLKDWRCTRRQLGLLLGASLAAPAVRAERRSLLVYTAVEPEWLPVYKSAFEAEHPDIAIEYVRASASPIAARLVAERERPQADVVLGLSAIAMMGLKKAGILTPYRPKNAAALDPRMCDSDFNWFGINAWGGSICINTDLITRLGIPYPKSWMDLLNPQFRGRIVMPSPAASSTGYMFFLGWLQGFGEKKGWDYCERLNRNMLFYTSSGARPAAMTAQG